MHFLGERVVKKTTFSLKSVDNTRVHSNIIIEILEECSQKLITELLKKIYK
jgi:hypothetical protein